MRGAIRSFLSGHSEIALVGEAVDFSQTIGMVCDLRGPMRAPPLLQKTVLIVLSLALIAGGTPGLVAGQTPPSYKPPELDKLVSRIALYPDPLLAQILAAATYPDQIPDAAKWADEHHYLTGDDLAKAITEDHLTWDASVQSAAAVSIGAGDDGFGHGLDDPVGQRVSRAAPGRDGRSAEDAEKGQGIRLPEKQRAGGSLRRCVYRNPAGESGLYLRSCV